MECFTENFVTFFLLVAILSNIYIYFMRKNIPRDHLDSHSGRKQEYVYIIAILPEKYDDFIAFCDAEKIRWNAGETKYEFEVFLTEKKIEKCLTHGAVREGRFVAIF